LATAPTYAASDYLAAIHALMPRGPSWPTDPGTTQDDVLSALVESFEASNVAAANLLTDAFPGSTVNLLPEWEATLGLPDPCAGEAPTLQERQSQVLARFANSGGQSKAFFIALAATLGFPVTIAQYTGADAYLWQVNALASNPVYFRAGVSTPGAPLQLVANSDVLECVFNALKPAHTTVRFVYT
jgi:uncharacterized protein YmfQ (DUF2313 family)